MINPERIITISDARKQKFCKQGMEIFLDKHGYSVADLRHKRIKVKDFLSIDDAMVKQFLEKLDAE
jgi:hypothetical protein